MRRICTVFDFPLSIAREPSIQLWENQRLIAFGCYTIDKYSKSAIVLSTPSHKILVLGNRLEADLFENNRIEINGTINSVQFDAREEDNNETI